MSLRLPPYLSVRRVADRVRLGMLGVSGHPQDQLAGVTVGLIGIVLLSADRPADVHSWTNAACLAAGRPFSAAGYIEGHGCVGPLLHMPQTPCFECIRLSANALADQQLDLESVEAVTVELNPGWQAPSYGPLNALVAAIQANETIRWLLGTWTATVGRRLLIDSRTYDVTWEDFEISAECDTCGRKASGTPVWQAIASQYQEERDHHSFGSVLLDDLIPELISPSGEGPIADVGAGAGQITARLLARGCQVDAYEPASAMLALPRERLAGNVNGAWRIFDQGIDGLVCLPGGYVAVCCVNVLDHVKDLDAALRTLANALRRGGTLVVSVPHPLKDRGGRKKTPQADGWSYQNFVVEDYFDEGPCEKVREDRHGEVRVRSVVTQHRTIASYLNAVLNCGLAITQVLEPVPAADVSEHDPVIYSKASRIPYFLVIVARKA